MNVTLPAAVVRRRVGVLLGLVGVVAAVVACLPPIPQDQDYHRFVDRRALLGIPNAGDVLSNGAFVIAGVWGLLACARTRFAGRAGYVVLFLGVALTGAGSAYYHLAPDDERLVWDRLPMTLGFMGLLAATIGERVGARWGLRLLAPLVALGVWSVLHWIAGERVGAGDLRPYIVVQFGSLLGIAGLLGLLPGKYGETRLLWAGLCGYALAKVCESLDGEIFAASGELVSGHTLKHVIAGAAVGLIVRRISRLRRG